MYRKVLGVFFLNEMRKVILIIMKAQAHRQRNTKHFMTAKEWELKLREQRETEIQLYFHFQQTRDKCGEDSVFLWPINLYKLYNVLILS